MAGPSKRAHTRHAPTTPTAGGGARTGRSGGAGAGGVSSLSVRRWDELVDEVEAKVGRARARPCANTTHAGARLVVQPHRSAVRSLVPDRGSSRHLARLTWRVRTPCMPCPQAATLRRSGNRAKERALQRGLSDALFAHAYPRLDVEVTKKMNHLLKVTRAHRGDSRR